MDTLRKTDALPSAPPAGSEAADTPETHPLAQSGGRFQDDPFWEEMLNSVRRHREEMDAEWNVPE